MTQIVFAVLADLILLVAAGFGFWNWRALTKSARFVSLCMGFWFIQDALMAALMFQGKNNLVFIHLGIPIETTLVLLVLAYLHKDQRMRFAFRVAAPVFIAVWAELFLFVENWSGFTKVTMPLQAILLVAAGAHTLVARLRSGSESLLREEWFWLTGGVVLYYAKGVLLDPIGALFVESRPDLVKLMFTPSIVLDLVILGSFTWGIFCARSPLRSSGFSSQPAPSR